MIEHINFTTTLADDGERLDKALTRYAPALSRTRLKALIEEGQVTVNGKTIVDPAYKLRADQQITITIPDIKEGIPAPENLPLTILYEDDDVIVIDKPVGLVVHPAPGNYEGTLVNALLAHCGESLSGIGDVRRPGIVHRLDKDTSGLMVVAKNDQAHQGLAAQFADRTLTRRYYALVWGIPKPSTGTIEGNIGRHPRQRQKMAVLKVGGKVARTHYKVVQTFGTQVSLVECQLETGRTHQVRVHMAFIGHSLLGDQIYGRAPRTASPEILAKMNECLGEPPRQALHAYHLKFVHPITSELMEFTSPLPEDMTILKIWLIAFKDNK